MIITIAYKLQADWSIQPGNDMATLTTNHKVSYIAIAGNRLVQPHNLLTMLRRWTCFRQARQIIYAKLIKLHVVPDFNEYFFLQVKW